MNWLLFSKAQVRVFFFLTYTKNVFNAVIFFAKQECQPFFMLQVSLACSTWLGVVDALFLFRETLL